MNTTWSKSQLFLIWSSTVRIFLWFELKRLSPQFEKFYTLKRVNCISMTTFIRRNQRCSSLQRVNMFPFFYHNEKSAVPWKSFGWWALLQNVRTPRVVLYCPGGLWSQKIVKILHVWGKGQIYTVKGVHWHLPGGRTSCRGLKSNCPGIIIETWYTLHPHVKISSGRAQYFVLKHSNVPFLRVLLVQRINFLSFPNSLFSDFQISSSTDPTDAKKKN